MYPDGVVEYDMKHTPRRRNTTTYADDYRISEEVLELNVKPDHVHLVMSIPPEYSVSNVMGYLKGKLALRLFDKYEHLGRRYWGRHLWSRGYCVSTIGLDEEKIRQYVKWQKQHDKESESTQGRLF